jgi:hypothetical protein
MIASRSFIDSGSAALLFVVLLRTTRLHGDRASRGGIRARTVRRLLIDVGATAARDALSERLIG